LKKRIGDRRGRARFEIVGTLTGTLETVQRFKVRNVGAGGALVDSTVPLPLHSRITGRLAFRGQSREVRGEVRHITPLRDRADTMRYLIGVQWEPPTRVADLLGAEPVSPAAAGARHTPERRTSARLPAVGDVEIGQPNWSTVELLDISTTGVLVASPVVVDVGGKAELRVRLGERSFAAQIEVKRTDSAKTGLGSHRLGAAFVGLDEGNRLNLEDFIGDARR
jgi:hypothetical protein